MRSTSNRSLICGPPTTGGPRSTPSSRTATAPAEDLVTPLVESPRMAPLDETEGTEREGRSHYRCAGDRVARCRSRSPIPGTSMIRSSRFCAVTMITASSTASALCGESGLNGLGEGSRACESRRRKRDERCLHDTRRTSNGHCDRLPWPRRCFAPRSLSTPICTNSQD